MREGASRKIFKALRHNSSRRTLGARGGFIHAHLNFLPARHTISRRANASSITSPHGESLYFARVYTVVLGLSSRGIPRVLSGFLSVTMATHVGRTQARRELIVMYAMKLRPLSFFLSRRLPNSKLYVQLLRSDFLRLRLLPHRISDWSYRYWPFPLIYVN